MCREEQAVEVTEQTPVTTEPAAPPARPWLRGAVAAALALGAVGFYALGLQRYISWDYLRGNLDRLQALAGEHLLLAAAAFFAVYVAVTALSLPAATALSLIAGAVFGRWLGTGIVLFAATLGATLAFLSSRYVFRDWVQRRFGRRLEAINRGVEKDGAYYLFTLRLVPAVPFFLINLGMGLTPLRTWTFAWVSLVGMLPGTFLYVNAGTAIASVDSPAGVLSPGVILSLTLLGVVPFGMRLLIRHRVRPRTIVAAGLVLLLLAAAGWGVWVWVR
ncbi:MAG TPA: TVP38/TMEM64 family protein [Gemmataceae bacterium]|nr:TVP38/TMEM64 family protein [Gemmataceae bacterium]